MLAEDALLTWERGGGTVDTLVAHTMDQVRQDLGLGPILALQVWCVAADGEHVWVVMELLEQGWVGAEYFWYPARDRLYFTHAEVLKKPCLLYTSWTGRCPGCSCSSPEGATCSGS